MAPFATTCAGMYIHPFECETRRMWIWTWSIGAIAPSAQLPLRVPCVQLPRLERTRRICSPLGAVKDTSADFDPSGPLLHRSSTSTNGSPSVAFLGADALTSASSFHEG